MNLQFYHYIIPFFWSLFTAFDLKFILYVVNIATLTLFASIHMKYLFNPFI